MMRVLVTGGRGYIGGRLVRALADDAAFSITVAGRPRPSDTPNDTTQIIDWSDFASIVRLCRAQDAVVHLAAMNEPTGERDPEGALRDNGFASLALLRAAEASGVRRFVYASTSKVFGTNPTGTIDESSLPRPASHYAITHRLSEDYVLAAHDKHRIEAAVLRLTNAIGAPADPAVDAWMLIGNDFCRQAAVTARIVLRSSGLAWRNFVTMTDIVAAIRHALVLPADRLGDGLFHLGGPQSQRILDLASRIAARSKIVLGRTVEIQRAEPTRDESHPPLDWRIGKLASTGWAPAADLNTEIDATLHLCRDAFMGAEK
jgi:UDP-glucose 4-epimerase